MNLVRTDPSNMDFKALVKHLDAELQAIYKEEYEFFGPLNTLGAIRHVVLAYEEGRPAGCGAMKPYDPVTMELKRMFSVSIFRGRGIGGRMLEELENWARELGYERCVLETGVKQSEAIRLYEKSAYRRTPKYPPYEHSASSICFEKWLL
jgi:putative acetyltransferase